MYAFWKSLSVWLWLLVGDLARSNPGCKGELEVCRVSSLHRQTDRQKCGSYPAEPSLVICASLYRSQLRSPLHCLHPSMCSQCHISPRVTLCPPNSNVRAPSGIHQHPTPPGTLFQTNQPCNSQPRCQHTVLPVLLPPVAGKFCKMLHHVSY